MKTQFFLIVSLFSFGLGLSFKPQTREQYCFRKRVAQGETIDVYGHISGANPEKVEMTVYGPFKKQIYNSNDEPLAMHNFQEKSEQGGNYELCFEAKEYKDKEIVFTVQTYKEQVIQAHADHESLDQLEKKFHQLSSEMDMIKNHIESQQNDEEAQYQITKANNRKVLWWSLGKILLIVCACLFELYLVTSYFAGRNTLGKRLVKLGMRSQNQGFNTGV